MRLLILYYGIPSCNDWLDGAASRERYLQAKGDEVRMLSLVFVRLLFKPGLLLAFGLTLVVFPRTQGRVSALTQVPVRVLRPAKTIYFDSNRTGNFEIYLMRNERTKQVQLTSDPTY